MPSSAAHLLHDAMEKRFESWCWKVTDQVRFWPDRTEIAKELTAHYEDHVKDLERLGYERELAEQRALGAMGDPVEIGRALDKAHKPWLGWLWQFTRGLILVLLAACLVVYLQADGRVNDAGYRIQNQLVWRTPAQGADRVETEHATLWLSPGEITEEDGHIHAAFQLSVKMKDPFGYSPNYAIGYLEITDDRGAVSRWDQQADDTWAEVGYWRGIQSTDISWTRYQWTLELVLDYAPEWVEIRYPYGGNDWTLRAEWGETA